MVDGSHEENDELAEIFRLLEEKQKIDCSLQTQQLFYQKACDFLKRHPACAWCRLTPIAVELLHLYSLPPNPFTELFEKITVDCLGSCSNCINAYHNEKPLLLRRLAENYEEEALGIFARNLEGKDVTRLSKLLSKYIDGTLSASAQSLLYGLFEILGYPNGLADPSLNSIFCMVMHSLIAAKKMLRVNKVMPGVLTLAFHSDATVRNWAVSVMATKLEPATLWNPELVGLVDIIESSKSFLTKDEQLRSAYHLLYWAPCEELLVNFRWIHSYLDNIDFNDHQSVMLLCVTLDRLTRTPKAGNLGLSNILQFTAKLFKTPHLFNLINDHAVFPAHAPELVLQYPYKICITQWIRLLCNLASRRRDGPLLGLVVDHLITAIPSLGSHDARNNVISLLINIVQFCTTAEELSKDQTFNNGVMKTLEFLARYFLQHSHPHKPNPLLLETCKTCIQFDCNQLNFSIEHNGGLLGLIHRLLVQFSEDRAVFELMIDVGMKIFVDAEGDQLALALTHRRAFLDYLVRTWPLLGKPDCCDPNHVMLLFIAVTFSELNFPSDFLSQFSKSNAVSLATCPGSWVKKIKVIEGETELFRTGVCRLIVYMEKVFLPNICPRNGTSLLNSAPNTLYLKLHLISAVASLLTVFVSSKATAEDSQSWRHFYSLCNTSSILIEFLGLDALKQCLRENAGMAKRFKNCSHWIVFFSKHCSILEPEKAKSLALFFKQIIILAASTKTSIHNLEKQISMYLATFAVDMPTSSLLKPAVTAYESEFDVNLNVKFVSAPAQIASVLPVLSTAPSPRTVMNIEDMFLERLKSEAGKDTGPKPLRMGNATATVPSVRPASKIGQLRQDFARELQPVKAKKKTNAAVNHTAKAMKLHVGHLDNDLQSSDFEESHTFVDTFKDDLSSISNAHSRETGRSVKLIPLNNMDVDVFTKAKKIEDDSFDVDPDFHMKRLQKYLLDLDIDAIDDRSLEGTNVKPIPDSFESATEYAKIFEPLLLFECRSQLLQVKMELDSAACFSVKVLAIASIDEYHEVTVGAEGDENSRLLSEHDYIMARLDIREPKSEIVGIVTQASFKGSRTEATIRFKFRPHQHQYQVELRIGLIWKIKKLCNWITNIREFNALHSIHDLRLSKAILKPTTLPIEDYVISSVSSMLEGSLELNQSQAQAIAVALNNPNPFTLIQGPPGTGKTKTILGLVGALFGRPFSSLSSKLRPQRLLICAPSNAAIDEIVRRLKAGIFDCYHQKFSPKILRLGSHEMIHEDVKDLTLDATIERTFNQQCKDSINLLAQQRESISELKKDLDFAEKMGRTEELQKMKQNLWQVKEAMKKNVGFIEGSRQNLRNKVVSEAQVVCSTLSSSGIDLLSKLQFDVVIIDEACQAVEVSALIPLQYGCKNCILVGDPNQLPPTVISQAASVFAYEQSLFQRIQIACPEAVQLLGVQYRMHPSISIFPNRYFYAGKLTDGPEMAQQNSRSWHRNQMLAPYRFFDILGRERNQVRRSGDQGTSKSNELEARACVALVAYLCSEAPSYNFAGKIGIVTPYKDQRRTLKREFMRKFGRDVLSHIEISTVDGYQGQEKEVIIFSCVRTCESRGIGFLNDARRLNVALTRAKCSLFILGHSDALIRNNLWRELVYDAKQRDSFVGYDGRFWESKGNLRPGNIYPPRQERTAPVAPASPSSEPVATFKIKTPMQRRREGDDSEAKPVITSNVATTTAKPNKPMLLDSLLDKLNES